MPKLTFFPLGNADCYLVDLAGGEKLLFDYANVRDPENRWDKRVDLVSLLWEDLRAAQRDGFDVVAFTHADDDHVCGMSEFFYLEHAAKYQVGKRAKIGELWVPAAVLVEDNLTNDGRILQEEARYRFRQGRGIRVFSRPGALKEWCATHGIDWETSEHLLTDAGQLVPRFTQQAHGVEFFVHSPFAERVSDIQLIDRNDCSLVLQATFLVGERETRFILSADTTWENFIPMIRVTRWHGNEDRLAWDIFKLPHHCSYLSLGPEKGTSVTEPVSEMKWLFEVQGADNGIIISTSDPIPSIDTIQPPHRQTAAFYRGTVRQDGFKVTMEHPRTSNPEPLIIWIDEDGARIEKRNNPGPSIMPTKTPRAG